MTKFNVLFTSVGRRVSLVRLFRKSLSEQNIPHKLVGADKSPLAPASKEVDKFYLVPGVDSKEYIPTLLEICKNEEIDLLVPLIDPELPVISRNKEKFKEQATTAMISSPQTIEIAMSKLKTSQFFKNQGLPALPSYHYQEQSWREKLSFPLMLKPDQGSASKGVYKIDNEKELEVLASRISQPIIQPLIKGREYTSDLFIDFQGKVRCVVPRLRIEVRAGEVSKGMTVRNENLISLIKKAGEALPGAFGVINIQAFEDLEGNFYLAEINPRFGGGYPLSYHAGADFPCWLYLMLKERDKFETINTDTWKENLVMLRYDDELIFPADKELLPQIMKQAIK